MATRRTLQLDGRQCEELAYHRDHDERPYVRERCAALLKVAEGHCAHAVARSGLLRRRDPDTVYSWLDLYLQGGTDSLFAHQQGGYRRQCL